MKKGHLCVGMFFNLLNLSYLKRIRFAILSKFSMKSFGDGINFSRKIEALAQSPFGVNHQSSFAFRVVNIMPD